MADQDERVRRIGMNEALFRQVNENVHELDDENDPLDQMHCECGDANCTEQVRIPTPEYEQVRSDATLFLVAPGHVAPDVEALVADAEGYQVVRKRPGAPEEIAKATDRR